ncbi:hypothetical protein [Agrococcus citreus]
MSQQPGTTPLPRLRRAFSVRRMLLTAAGGAAILGLALSGVGGSYALWSSQARVSAGTISSGSAALTAAWGTGYDDQKWRNMLPRESIRQPFVVVNTGDVAMALSASVTPTAPGFEVRAAAGACSTTPLAGARLSATPTAVVAAASPVVLPAGASFAGCIEVRATDAATPASNTAFTITLDGRQAP